LAQQLIQKSYDVSKYKHKNNKELDSMVTDKALNIAQGIKQENKQKLKQSWSHKVS